MMIAMKLRSTKEHIDIAMLFRAKTAQWQASCLAARHVKYQTDRKPLQIQRFALGLPTTTFDFASC